MLTRDQILAATDLPTETVNVPEWGGDVRLRSMTGEDRDRWESAWIDYRKQMGDQEDMGHFRAHLLSHVIVDDAGNPLFSESDIARLARLSGKAIVRVSRAAMRMNGIGGEAEAGLEKNSGAALSGESGSG
jgi:hypothetical protein